MSKNVKETTEEGLEIVEETLTKTEQFIEDNQKMLSIIIGAIVVIVGGYMAYNKFIYQPKQEEALSQLFAGEQYFEKDSFNLAINGDGGMFLGFLNIIDEYGSTNSGELAKCYTGLSYFHLKNYDEAINYLSDFSTEEPMVGAVAKGTLGDAYAEKGDIETAVKHYKEAIAVGENEFTSPLFILKVAKAYESLGKYNEAIQYYEKLEKEYSETTEGRNAEKYIARVKALQ